MMEHFKLCYKLPAPEKDSYLVPAALQADIPEKLEWNHDDVLKFQYKYNTLPVNIIANFIVRTLPHKRNDDYWRFGIIIEHENNEARIRADHFNKIIDIEITGKGNRRITLSYIRTTLDIIHRGFSIKDIAPSGLVPLDKKGEITIPYDDLLIMEQEGIKEQFIPQLRKKIIVKDVLEGIRSSEKLDNIFFENLSDQIAGGRIEEVINKLLIHPELRESEFYNDIILVSSQWHSLAKDRDRGTADNEVIRVETAKVAQRTLSIIKEIRQRSAKIKF
ncbi:MAG: hypothetical protein GY749_21970 [Desulfobacteraceae bacterium]|nr:hypothetical protein [Desulfobacteraceae bacterium]